MNEHTFFLTPTSDQDVLEHILNLDPKKAIGPDNLGNRIILLCPELFSILLSTIYNYYINKGEYPTALKLAKVIPIYKEGDHSSPDNYRPISLLSCFNKKI